MAGQNHQNWLKVFILQVLKRPEMEEFEEIYSVGEEQKWRGILTPSPLP